MTARRYMLHGWIVRALLPTDTIGAYVLWTDELPVYAGRSDTSLRRRLLEHAGRSAAPYFSFDVAHSTQAAFDLECSLFHALSPGLRNHIHPQRPVHQSQRCSFCFDETLRDRLSPRV